MNKDNALGFSIGLLAGAIIGGVVTLLFAPKSGKETRKIIKNTAGEAVEKVAEVAYAVKEKTGEVVDKVEEAASDVEQKGEAVINAIKG
jgi:gas vesicle protein